MEILIEMRSRFVIEFDKERNRNAVSENESFHSFVTQENERTNDKHEIKIEMIVD